MKIFARLAGLRAGISLLGLLVPAAAVHAQDTSEAAAPAEAEEAQSGGLNEIIVTAQRREQSLQKVPIAVSAVDSTALETAGIQSTSQLAQVVPGIQFNYIAGNTNVSIRGVGTQSYGPGAENPVGVYVDGVHIATTAGLFFQLANVDRVEVLKGPQGTLFGRNTTGGLVHVITSEPPSTVQGLVRASYGNYDSFVGDLYAGGPVSSTVSADLAVRYARQGKGYGRNVTTGDEVNRNDNDLIVRSKVKFEPTPDLKFILAGDYMYSEGTGTVTLQQRPGLENVGTFEKIFTNRLDADASNDLPLFNKGGFYDISSPLNPSGKTRAWGTSLTMDWDLGGATLQSITAYRKSSYKQIFSLVSIPVPLLTFDGKMGFKQFSQELKINGNVGKLNYTGGLYYFNSKDAWEPYFIRYEGIVAQSVDPSFTTAEQTVQTSPKTKSYAAYGQLEYEFLLDTHLTLGGRYTKEKRSADGIQQFIGFVGTTPVPIIPAGTPFYAPGFDNHLAYENFSYRIALDHQLTRDVLLYASYNTGFKSGGFNSSVPSNPAYLPEKLKAWEAGFKSEFFNRTVRLNASAFYYDYTNIQVSNYISTSLFITNGAKARIYGGEAELLISPVEGLTLNTAAAYTHDRFTSYPDADYNYVVPGCDFSNPSSSRVCQADASGNKLPNTPTFSGNVGFAYQAAIGDGSFGITGNVYHNSGWFGTTDNDVRMRQEKYELVNGSVYWEPNDNGLRITLWVDNLFNEKYARTRLISSGAGKYAAGAPRLYGIRVQQSF